MSGGRCTQGLEVGKGEKGPPKRVAQTSARRRRKDRKATVVPAGPIEEREATIVETSDKRDELGSQVVWRAIGPRAAENNDVISLSIVRAVTARPPSSCCQALAIAEKTQFTRIRSTVGL